MAVQDTTIQANVNNYFFKTRADYEAHASEILNNSTIYIESDGEYGNVKMNLLWENPSPSSSFAAQIIDVLDMSPYDYLLIDFKATTGSDILFTQLTKKGIDGRLFYGNGSAQYPEVRNFTFPSNTTISFQNAKENNATNNSDVIPVRIYGLKIVPVSDSSGGGSQVSIVDWSLGGNT